MAQIDDEICQRGLANCRNWLEFDCLNQKWMDFVEKVDLGGIECLYK